MLLPVSKHGDRTASEQRIAKHVNRSYRNVTKANISTFAFRDSWQLQTVAEPRHELETSWMRNRTPWRFIGRLWISGYQSHSTLMMLNEHWDIWCSISGNYKMWCRLVWWKFTEISEKPVSYFCTLKLEARGSSEKLLNLYQTTRRQIPESDITELQYIFDVKNKETTCYHDKRAVIAQSL